MEIKTFQIKYRTTRNTEKEAVIFNPHLTEKTVSWWKRINKYPYEKKVTIPRSMIIDYKWISTGTI